MIVLGNITNLVDCKGEDSFWERICISHRPHNDRGMAWHLAKLQLETTVGAYERILECADTEGRLVKLGGNVLKFRWLVLLGSRIPTIGLLGIVGLERVV